jgi:hypothetical protein
LLSELRLPSIRLMWAKLAEQSDKEGWPAARFLAVLARPYKPGSQTTPGPTGARSSEPADFAFRQVNNVGTRVANDFAVQWLAYTLPYRRFADVLADACARIGGDVGWSGRIEARTGLRMMPTFPRSPLSFRTAGFPRYGWKAGFSDGAFPACTRA